MKMLMTMMMAVAVQEAPRGGKVEWRRDVEAALAEATKAARPAMLYFTADW